MLRALLALSLLFAGTVHAREIVFKKRFDHRWDLAGWNTYVRTSAEGRTELVAFNQSTMQLEVINPLTGETITQDSLDTKARGAHLVETLNTREGEFLIAFATANRVELHGLNNSVSYEIPFDTAAPQALSLIERGAGEIYLLVQTQKGVEVYVRGKDTLERDKADEASASVRSASLRVQGTRAGTWRLWPATAKRSSVLSNTDIDAVPTRVDLPVGNAHQIQDVGVFMFDGMKYYFFVKDGSQLVIQSENSGSAIPNKRHERIASVRVVPAARALAVTLESGGHARLLMVGLK
jgi:hypothetical protein